MYTRQTRSWAAGAWIGTTGLLTLVLAAQQLTGTAGDASHASTSIASLQSASASKTSEVTIGAVVFLGTIREWRWSADGGCRCRLACRRP